MKAPIAAFLLVLAASSAFAQTVAPELAPAAAKYKADMATLDAQRLAALAQAQKSHAAALDAAEKTATAAGNLPVVAAITKERESLIADTLTPNFPDGLPKNLLATRKAYLDAAAHIRANEATRRSAIGAEYLRALASLQSKAAANPELAQQIATEKGNLLANTIPNGTKPSVAAKSQSQSKPALPLHLSAAKLKIIRSYFEGKTWEFSAPDTKGSLCYFAKGGGGAFQQLNGKHGEKVFWQLDDDGTLVINNFNYQKRVTFTSPSTAECSELVGGERGKGYPIHLSDRTITPQ